MFDFSEKRRIRRILYSRFTIALLLILLIFLLDALWGVYQKAHNASENKKRTVERLRVLEGREADLLASIEKLKTERGIEDEIRNKFSVVKEGEEMVVIVDLDAKNVENGGHGFINPRDWWQKFLSIF